MNTGPRLPLLKTAPPPAFQTGAYVNLKRCPGPPGVVVRTRRGRVHVRWPDLHYTGRHSPDALVLAGGHP